MQVLKFGGTSVGSAQNIERVIDIVSNAVNRDRTILVCSAFANVTDCLISIGLKAAEGDKTYEDELNILIDKHIIIAKQLISLEYESELGSSLNALFQGLKDLCYGVYVLKEFSSRTYDNIVSYGELLSTKIISLKFKAVGINHVWVDSRDIIKTKCIAEHNVVDTDAINENVQNLISLSSASLFIFGGFIASDESGYTTTLGRGGSDYTASLLAVASRARQLEIWTDVDGMMTADPRIVPSARTISNISYTEALELSHFGAKVVYPPTISPVVKQSIPIYVRNTFAPNGNFTLIEANPPQSELFVKGISSSDKIALLSLEGNAMVGASGYCGRLFNTLAVNNIDVILITQASSVNTMCVVIWEKDAQKAKKSLDETFAYDISLGRVNPLIVECGFSIISLVGSGFRQCCGLGGRMFSALGKNGVNIRAIAQGSSERNITTIVHTSELCKAVRVIHEELFEDVSKLKNRYLFVCGYGNVSKSLFHIIREQKEYIANKYNINLLVAGLCNSRKFIYDKNGIDINNLDVLLENGEDNVNNVFIEKVLNNQLTNSVFVDCTANSNIASYYGDMFQHNISVVTCNKIANSAPLASYDRLFKALVENNCSYKYETTVGAALPIISTIDQIQKSGDKVNKIEAVLSGTLNYLFSTYDTSSSFSKIIQKAKELAYTEPDPRLDLKGVDVLRKLTIIARQIGLRVNQSDIEYNSFIDTSLFNGDLDGFYAKVEDKEAEFSELYRNAENDGKHLRFIAKIENGKCSVSLEAVGEAHPFYSLNGTDNAILIYSDYYKSPLLVQGAGAGGLQTASGVLNDVLTLL